MQDPNQAPAAGTEQDKRAKVHRIQTDLAILDADLNKVERIIEDLKLKLKKDRHEKDELGVEIEEEDMELRKLEGEQMMLTAEIRKLRKKMNLLT
jgi:chromosome segregation ATPase